MARGVGGGAPAVSRARARSLLRPRASLPSSFSRAPPRSFAHFMVGSVKLLNGTDIFAGGERTDRLVSTILEQSGRKGNAADTKPARGWRRRLVPWRRRRAAAGQDEEGLASSPPPAAAAVASATTRRPPFADSDPDEPESGSKYRARFDGMVREFSSWDEDAALVERARARNPRLAEVLDGCFAGARNPSVVRALRVIYEDYRALRMGGDLVFKLMRTLVGK